MNYNQTIACVVNSTHSLKGNIFQSYSTNPLFKAFYGIKNAILTKDPLEAEILTFDFSSALTTETVTSANVKLVPISGFDTNPMQWLNTFSNSSGKQVWQVISGGVLENVYQAICTITTNDSQTLVIRVDISIQKSA